jgi:hypothetical protein
VLALVWPASRVLNEVPVTAERVHEPSGAVLVLVVMLSKLPLARRSAVVPPELTVTEADLVLVAPALSVTVSVTV